MKRLLVLVALFFLLIFLGSSDRKLDFSFKNFGNLFKSEQPKSSSDEKIHIVSEESVITSVVDKVSPSVVTVSVMRSRSLGSIFEDNQFDPFDLFNPRQSQQPRVEQDIGTGFIVSKDGLIVTNKHVVSDTEAKYRVVTHDDKTYDVEKIYRDPTNDLAIIKIANGNLSPLEMGDSSKIKVGQLAIAIGTALGEFRNTVTVGVISGLGRGITAGSPFEGFEERLDNVIQTNAAINPGNSGGPLLASSGQVIGINTAVSQSGQNIGFAIPINIVKDSLTNFNQTGQFNRPYLGVTYTIINQRTALLNNVPQGAYIQDITNGSPAEQAGIQKDDIIVKVDGKNISGSDGSLADIISNKKVGDTITVTVYRDADMKDFRVKLAQAPGD